MTNPEITENQIRYSQGYINALDWVELTFKSLAEEEREEGDD